MKKGVTPSSLNKLEIGDFGLSLWCDSFFLLVLTKYQGLLSIRLQLCASGKVTWKAASQSL